jgi:acetate kinase
MDSILVVNVGSSSHPRPQRDVSMSLTSGAGASMRALSAGHSVESTMGFTALDGIPMGTRPGQIDPGVILYLIEQKKMSAAAVSAALAFDVAG